MGKIFLLIGLLMVNISCSQSNKLDVDMEYNEEFIKKMEIMKGFLYYRLIYIFLHINMMNHLRINI